MKKAIALMLSATMILSSFAACGSSGESNSGNAQGVTDTSVKVGNSIATSGAYAPVGLPFKAGIEAYFEMVNQDGGIHGRTIDYVHQDDEFSPEKGKAAVDWLINDEEVFALVGHFGTPVVGATLDDIMDAGIPAVYFATGIGELYNENAEGNERVIYPVQPVYPMEGRILGAWAKGEFNADKVGVIYTNDDAGKDLLGGIEQTEGIEIIAEQVPPNADDVSAAVTRLKNEEVEVVIIAAIQGTFPQIAKEMAKQGMDVPAITCYVNVAKAMTEAVIDDIDGQFEIYGNAWVDPSSPNMEEFAEWMIETGNPDLTKDTYAMTGWVAAYFFCEGLRRVDGELTWDTYMDALESEPIQNPFGGSIDYSDGKRLGTQEMALYLMTRDSSEGWEEYQGFKSIEDILGQ